MPRSQSQRGDFTGRQRERLTEEHSAEVTEAQERLGTINRVEQVIEAEGVFDPATQDVVEVPPGADTAGQVTYVSDENDVIDVESGGLPRPADPFKDLQSPVVQQQEKPVAPNPHEVQDLGEDVLTVEPEYMTFRVNSDIEEMTYGAGTILTFVRGRKYRAPLHLYKHLDSKGLIYH